MPLKRPDSAAARAGERGLTLVELAIVMVLVALFSGGLLMTLSARHDAMAMAETRQGLADARDALLGYAAANGRLPCPAAPGSSGAESPPGGGTCTHPWDGLLPAVTLGLAPTDSNGYAIDHWGNPIRYALTAYGNSSYCPGHMFATTNCVKAAWPYRLPAPDLHVCTTAAGLTGHGATASCAAGTTLASDAIAVIFSRGSNGAASAGSADEAANGDADRLFVAHPQNQAGTTNQFDDIVFWLSPNILYHSLIAAGRLP